MGQLASDEYVTKFLELLRYAPYLKDEKAKIHRFITGLPMAFIDKIKFLEPQTLKDDINKLGHCYEQPKHRTKNRSNW